MSRTNKHPYTKEKAVSKHCRNSSGKCLYCSGNRTYKNDKKLWKRFGTKLVSFCLSAMSVVAISCGHRKTELSKTEIKKDTLISVLSEKKIKVDSNYTFDFSTFKIYPIDISKPILINGNSIQNASIEGAKKIENGNIKRNITELRKETNAGVTQTEIKTKQTEKSDYTILYSIIALIIVSGIIVYLKLPNLNKS